MTSNVGAAMAKKQTSLGFGVTSEPSSDQEVMKEKILTEAKNHFKPELLNRLDNMIVFRHLDKPELNKIVDLEVHKIIERLKEQELELVLDDSAKDFLIEKGYDPANGARPMRRAVEKYIEDPMSEEILKETFKAKDRVIAKKDGDKLMFSVDKPVQTKKKKAAK
jgi:ATP-dependent Clp protease ATP-binding subunit ClpC